MHLPLYLPYIAPARYGLRINTISAGALKSRAASAIGGARGEKTYIEYCIDYSEANSPLQQDLTADDVGHAAAYLCSPLARAITGVNLYVDNGLQASGRPALLMAPLTAPTMAVGKASLSAARRLSP